MADLSGKRVFISAAGQGIGRSSVEAFLAVGAEVIATDLNPDLIKALPEHERLTAYKVDVMDKAELLDGLCLCSWRTSGVKLGWFGIIVGCVDAASLRWSPPIRSRGVRSHDVLV